MRLKRKILSPITKPQDMVIHIFHALLNKLSSHVIIIIGLFKLPALLRSSASSDIPTVAILDEACQREHVNEQKVRNFSRNQKR